MSLVLKNYSGRICTSKELAISWRALGLSLDFGGRRGCGSKVRDDEDGLRKGKLDGWNFEALIIISQVPDGWVAFSKVPTSTWLVDSWNLGGGFRVNWWLLIPNL